ncbi:hypothetical protein BGW80DRAFT_1256940 [Lactifluus volemus]|nr:hypothetical protein BGW80DRAFT_1256940 [Lactifluus volemus]
MEPYCATTHDRNRRQMPEIAERTITSTEDSQDHDGTEHVILDVAPHDGVRRVFATSQIVDYQHRGDALSGYNVLQFFVDTYEERVKQAVVNTADSDSDSEAVTQENNRPCGMGRPKHDRVRYREGHPKANLCQRVIRPQGHRNLPNFMGRYFPRNDDPEIGDFYYASVLMLLKPWRNVGTDLKGENDSWSSAYQTFVSDTSAHVRSIISGLQYYHECEASANNTGDSEPGHGEEQLTEPGAGNDVGMDITGVREENEEERERLRQQMFTEERVAKLLASEFSFQEQNHGMLAIEIAKSAGVFRGILDSDTWNIQENAQNRNAVHEDEARLTRWKYQMQRDVAAQNETHVLPWTDSEDGSHADVQVLQAVNLNSDPAGVSLLQGDEGTATIAVEPKQLNKTQSRAFDIIVNHVYDQLSGKNPKGLRMILYGEGGTGKSKVIEMVTNAFADAGD